jgi:protein-S-isoprenylcysteine O-methyltransferase Ste14
MKSNIGKILYGVSFCIALPGLLFLLAQALDRKFPALPPTPGVTAGLALLALGSSLLLRGMWELWVFGGGLPMNAYPPKRFVAHGLYGWLPHPIYLGFALSMLGVFSVAGMPAGVWIVSPILWLGTTALVVGYERMGIRRHFGGNFPRPRLALPPDSAARPKWWHIAATYLLLLGPWVAGYEGIARLLQGRDCWEAYLPMEHNWRVLEWTTVLYASAYLWVALAPWSADSQSELRRFIRGGWVGSAAIFFSFLILPITATPRPFDATTFLGQMLQLDRAHDTAFCAFPSFHVFWPLLAARLWARRLTTPVAYGLAALMALSCVTTGMHSVVDALAGLGMFIAVDRLEPLWGLLIRITERIANSWREWRIGVIRIINHGAYVALAAGAGVWLVGFLLGARYTSAIAIVAMCSLVGAGLWAQMMESSSGLSRPFGYFGSIFGGLAGLGTLQIWRGGGWLLLGAFAVAAPLVQGTGRLRCLVQGCCHGRPSPDHLGIRYRHPLSRVCKLAHWSDTLLYPTPLYSIIGNAVIFGLLLRLWVSGVDLSFIAGSYFILSACARFMEEGYRGEPQTVHFGGLAIYQWLAVLFVICGAVCLALPSPLAPSISGAGVHPLTIAVPFSLLVGFAMGVDFPESSRRYSRLA